MLDPSLWEVLLNDVARVGRDADQHSLTGGDRSEVDGNQVRSCSGRDPDALQSTAGRRIVGIYDGQEHLQRLRYVAIPRNAEGRASWRSARRRRLLQPHFRKGGNEDSSVRPLQTGYDRGDFPCLQVDPAQVVVRIASRSEGGVRR